MKIISLIDDKQEALPFYLMYMYDVHAKTVPTNLDNFVKIGKKKTSLSSTIISKAMFLCQIFQNIDERKTSFTRISVSNWNSIPPSVKSLNKSNFRKINK